MVILKPSRNIVKLLELPIRTQLQSYLALCRTSQLGKTHCLFVPQESVISCENCILQNLWQGMYLRWIVDPTPQREAHKKMSEIIQKNRETRGRVLQLRRKLENLEAQAEKMGIVKQ